MQILEKVVFAGGFVEDAFMFGGILHDCLLFLLRKNIPTFGRGLSGLRIDLF